MSRDLTPRELVYLDQQYHFKTEKLTLTNLADGSDSVLYDPDSPQCREYPWLAYLLDSSFIALYNESLSNADFHKKLTDVERELSEIIKEDIVNRGHLSDGHSETIVMWYAGALDPGFYYSEYNKELFINWLKGVSDD